MSEMNVLKRALLLLSSATRATMFRQNVGQGWAGRAVVIRASTTVRVGPGDVVIRGARPLHAGLIKGSSDLIGWTRVTVKPEHVGKTIAVFTAVECKSEDGPVTTEQTNFIDQVNAAGGLAGVARTPGEAVEIVSRLSTERGGL